MFAAALRFTAYFLGALVVTMAAHGYLYARLLRDAAPPAAVRRAGAWALALLAALLPLGMLALLRMRTLPRALASPVHWSAFAWTGVLLFLLPLVALGTALTRIAARAVPSLGGRRRALARIVAASAPVSALALAAGATRAALGAVQVRRVRVTLPQLARAHDGYVIVQLSDLHVGATTALDFVARLVAQTNALAPDLVVLTGDLVDGSVTGLAPLLAPLAGLRARDGVFLVTGNHEYLSGADAWLAHVPSLGVRPLRNEHVALRGPGGFDLAGVDDDVGAAWLPGHGRDLPRALDGRDRSRPIVLLAHRPTVVHEAALHGVALQLSGHTHGGQLRPLDFLERPFVAGLYTVGATTLFVSTGAGYWGPPMRLGTRPEITRVELVGRG